MADDRETAWTRGPWRAQVLDHTICVIGPESRQDKPIVHWMGFDDTRRTRAKNAANARLIAAAPALYAALAKIEFDWDGEPEDMVEARAALSLATGKEG